MVRWFVLASVPSLAFGTDEVGGGLNEGLVGVVHQLLRVRHLRVETGLNVQSMEGVRVGAVSLLLRDKVQEFAGSGDGLNLLFRRNPVRHFLTLLGNPVRQFRVGTEWFGHIGMGHLSSS